MRKLLIYLDTSFISHLEQEDVPEKKYETNELWFMFLLLIQKQLMQLILLTRNIIYLKYEYCHHL